jgi:anthranilate synthase/aminodeoxychorismate synthase-like glutamine amidotransferase
VPHRREPAYRLGKKVLLLDNYDSYTHNVRQYLEKLGADVEIMRNDVSEREMIAVKPDFLVVSPGPHTPNEAGLSMRAMRYFPEKGIPSLGICLGHQALVMAYGGEVGRYKAVHGKSSEIVHDSKTIFRYLPERLEVQRYHSLIADMELPDELEASAHTFEDGSEILMAVRHKELPAEGVQFHPESEYTKSGMTMLRNFLETRK